MTITNEHLTVSKTLPAAQFLHESGLLFKINRDVLHPRGLALAIVQDDDGTFRMSEELLDCRDKGIEFGEESIAHGEAKLRRFASGSFEAQK